MAEWQTHGYEISRLKTNSIQEFGARLGGESDRPFVLDVRAESEWDSGRIEEARHVHGGKLRERLTEAPPRIGPWRWFAARATGR